MAGYCDEYGCTECTPDSEKCDDCSTEETESENKMETQGRKILKMREKAAESTIVQQQKNRQTTLPEAV